MRRKSYGKVLACILLAASMMSSLSACGDKKEPENNEVQNESTTAADTEGETNEGDTAQGDTGGDSPGGMRRKYSCLG